MTEETFFAALTDHFPTYSLVIRYNSHCPLAPYAVELFHGKETDRCAGLTVPECFSSLVDALGIYPRSPAKPASQTLKLLGEPAPTLETGRGKTGT